MAGGQTVYASPSALYVGTPEWAPEPESADMPPERALTTVHKFDASNPTGTLLTARAAAFPATS